MTKNDYRVITQTISKMKSLGDDHLYVADLFAHELAKTDPEFNRDKFLRDCKIAPKTSFEAKLDNHKASDRALFNR